MPVSDPFFLPPAPAAGRRGPLPVLACLVPLAGALVLWLVTSSPMVLWFAALGPVMAVASVLDARRGSRRESRRAARVRATAIARVRDESAREAAAERGRLRARHPDAAGFAAAPDEIWRSVPGRPGMLVIGRGAVPSPVRIAGDDLDSARLRDETRTVADAPVVVPAEGGVAVTGPSLLAAGVVRALALQLLCQYPPGALTMMAPGTDWAEPLPHTRRAPLRLLIDRPPEPGAISILAVPLGAPPPPECRTVVTLLDGCRARLDHDGRRTDVEVEIVAAGQARALAAHLRARTESASSGAALPARLGLADLPVQSGADGLHSPIGVDGDGPVELDLLADGPHAVVAGMTGAGKSELLITWVAGLAARYDPTQVTFLLVDFKGGTAFQRLAGLPHVTGVITDLDAAAARRAIASLSAEIRHREARLTAVRARTVADAGLPRLVIVVDEFAALLDQAPELAAVFTDVAARGRALGLHLVLGTQRAAGVMREALLANCPLRISLAVADDADSRFLLGTADAADETSPGIAYVRPATARRPIPVRVALTSDADIERIRAATRAVAVRTPWLPELPERLPLSAVPTPQDGLVIGIADEPDHQRQRPVALRPIDSGLAVLGGPASGRSGLLAALAAQDARAVVLPATPEAAWDALAALEDDPPHSALLIADDLDVLLTRYPPDVAAAFAERLALLARGSGVRPVVSAARFTGPAARVAETCNRRMLLRLPTRLDHIAAGGEAATFDPRLPRGRGVMDGVTVQAVAAAVPAAEAEPVPAAWWPSGAPTAIVVGGTGTARRVADALRRAGFEAGEPGGGGRVVIGDAEQWQRAWPELTRLRADGELVVDAMCPVEYRVLTGDRRMAPYCDPARGRAWLCRAGDPAQRVLLPGASGRPVR